MDNLFPGVVVFILFTGIINGMMLLNLRSARAEGVSGQGLFRRMLPYLLADGVFTVVFVLWLWQNL